MLNFRERGLTLLEILVAVAILMILASLIVFGYGKIRTRIEGVQCANNMRSLHSSFASYVNDNGSWPQEPPELALAPHDANEDWWLETMKPYGATEKVWQCPAVVRQMKETKKGRPKLHYTPTMFDGRASTPYKWKTQPWIIEINNMHGDGALVCFPDGTIKTMNDVLGYHR